MGREPRQKSGNSVENGRNTQFRGCNLIVTMNTWLSPLRTNYDLMSYAACTPEAPTKNSAFELGNRLCFFLSLSISRNVNLQCLVIHHFSKKKNPQPYPSIPGKTEQRHPNLPPRPAGHLHIFSIDPAVVSLPEVKNQALRGAEEIPAVREEAYRHQDLLRLRDLRRWWHGRPPQGWRNQVET